MDVFEKVKCSACGKVIQTEGGAVLPGYTMLIHIPEEDKKLFSDEFVQKQLGDYKPGKNYSICFECWIKSLNIKP